MSSTVTPIVQAEPVESVSSVGRWRRPVVHDLLAVVGYLLVTAYVTARFWINPAGRASTANLIDQYLFEWMLSHAARSVTELSNPLFSDRVNAPDGVNVMANASVLGLAVPLTPVTVLWGPTVAYAVMITVALAGTAVAWYFVLSRYVVTSRFAAFVGGGFAAFAPGMISQATGHAHMIAQFLVPLIVWRVFRLAQPRPAQMRPVRDGVILGLLITYQVFIGEEVLFFTALACAVAVVTYALMRPREALGRWRPFAAGLGTAVGVAAVLLAYPLYVQFFGPGYIRGLPGVTHINADLGGYPRFSYLTLAGEQNTKTPFGQNSSELNSFFGWPLLLVVAGIVGWLRRELAARIAAVVAVVFAVLSFGRQLDYADRPIGVPGPWQLVADLPLFGSVVPTRFALVTAAAFAVLLALALDRALRASGPTVRGVPRVGLLWTALIVLALLPVAPRPLPAREVPPVPTFFTSGAWRAYVSDDGAVMVVPPDRGQQRLSMRWAAAGRGDFRITDGYFLGPIPDSPQRYGTLVRPVTPFMKIILDAYGSGVPAQVTDADRAVARDEMALKRVAAVVMLADQARGDAIRSTLDAMLGPGQRVADVWLWDVRQ
jgi:hypothetical protein